MKIQPGKIPNALFGSSLGFLEWRSHKWKIDRQINLNKEMYKEIIFRRYEKIAEVRFHDSWIDFGKEFKNYDKDEKRLFRGQSNKGNEYNFEFLEITSSLNREYPQIDLENFLQEVRNGIPNFKQYKYFDPFKDQLQVKDLDVLSYLQHYGISTPLVDFTFDPLTAMFFAVAGMPYEEAYGTDSRFLSIFEINCEILMNQYKIKEINNEITPRLFTDIERLIEMNPLSEFSDYSFAQGIKTGIIPQNKLSRELNPNFENQDGAFLLLDIPHRAGEMHEKHYLDKSLKTIKSFEDILQVVAENKNPSEKAMTLHLIPYESVFMYGDKNVFHGPDVILLFLTLRKKTGYDLFTDIQGFKYDYLFSTIKQHSSLDSLLSKTDSPEKRFLKEHGLI